MRNIERVKLLIFKNNMHTKQELTKIVESSET